MGSGGNSVNRVTLIWADGSIVGKWLQVTFKASTSNGLAADDVFYFGNAPGETGNDSDNTFVDVSDFSGARDNQQNFLHPATITNVYDFDRDHFVDVTDFSIARDFNTTFLTDLRLITAPGAVASAGDFQPVTAPDSAAVAAPAADDTSSDDSASAPIDAAASTSDEGFSPAAILVAIDAPVVAAPIEPAILPVEPVITSVESTIAPVEPAVAPIEPVIAPVEPVVATVEPTSTSSDSSIASVEPTSQSIEPGIAPAASTITSVEPMVAQLTSVSTSVEPVVALIEPTSAPVYAIQPTAPELLPIETLVASTAVVSSPALPVAPAESTPEIGVDVPATLDITHDAPAAFTALGNEPALSVMATEVQGTSTATAVVSAATLFSSAPMLVAAAIPVSPSTNIAADAPSALSGSDWWRATHVDEALDMHAWTATPAISASQRADLSDDTTPRQEVFAEFDVARSDTSFSRRMVAYSEQTSAPTADAIDAVLEESDMLGGFGDPS